MRRRNTVVRKDNDGVILVSERDAPPPHPRRLLGWLREGFSWLLWCIVPLFIIYYGIDCLQSEHIPAWRSRREKFGEAAVGYSWIMIGIGLWGLGQCCYAKCGRPVMKVLGWILGAAACGVGVWIRMK